MRCRAALAPMIGLLLAACGGPRISAAADPAAACAQSAERDPDVHAIRIKQLAGTYQAALYENDYKAALNRAIDTCMAGRGLARPGGVEAVRHD